MNLDFQFEPQKKKLIKEIRPGEVVRTTGVFVSEGNTTEIDILLFCDYAEASFGIKCSTHCNK